MVIKFETWALILYLTILWFNESICLEPPVLAKPRSTFDLSTLKLESSSTLAPIESSNSFIQATSLSPQNGPVNGVTKLSINGVGFSLVPKLYIHFDVTEGPYEVVEIEPISDTLLEVKTPINISKGDIGKTVLVSVYSHPNVVLQSNSALIFRVYPIPVITKIYPDHIGMSGGTEIIIFGHGLFATDDLKCLFQSKERSKIVDASYSMRIDPNTIVNKQMNNLNNTTLTNEKVDNENKKKIKESDNSTTKINLFKSNTDIKLSTSPLPSIVCESPSWTVSETVSLSISFNGIQYHLCTENLVFEEESSLFGNVAHVVKERDQPSEKLLTSSDKINILKNDGNVKQNSVDFILESSIKHHNSLSENNNIHRYTDNSGNSYTLSNPINASLLQSDYGLFLEIVILLYSSFIFGTICRFIGLPLLLGYIIGGYIVGPYGFGYISQPIQMISIAQIGVCLILFMLGLEFSLKRVLSIGKVIVYCAISSLLLFILLCSTYSIWIGTPIREGIFIGAFISMSSTAVVIGELQLDTKESMLTIGVLILQDLLLGLILALIPALQISTVNNTNKGYFENNLNNSKSIFKYKIILIITYFSKLTWKILKPFLVLFLFGLISYIVKVIVFPFILFFLLRTKNREIILIGIISIVLSISSLTEYLGLSMEMGSFVAGIILSSILGDDDSHFKHDFIQSVESLKWLFSMLFFTSIGLVIDATFIWDNCLTIGTVCIFISLIKFSVNFILFLIFGHDSRIAGQTAVLLANLGEFGFVLASKGMSLGIISRKVYLLLVGITVVSLITTPIILKLLSYLTNQRQTSIQLCDIQSIDTHSIEIKNIANKLSSSKFSSFYHFEQDTYFYKRKISNKMASLVKGWNLFKNNNCIVLPSDDEYENPRIFGDNVVLNNINKSKQIDNDHCMQSSDFDIDSTNISLENIDEFTLAHVTHLNNSMTKR
ncbi:sodium/hydrogen exchanger family protein [Cryptosporidium serpentis]